MYPQDDVEEVVAEASNGDTFRGLCSRQYTCQNSAQFAHEMLSGNMKSASALYAVKYSLVGSHVRNFGGFKKYSLLTTLIIIY